MGNAQVHLPSQAAAQSNGTERNGRQGIGSRMARQAEGGRGRAAPLGGQQAQQSERVTAAEWLQQVTL
jgi:hypothetical protein